MNNIYEWMLEKQQPEIEVKSPRAKALIHCKIAVGKMGYTWQDVIAKNRKAKLVDMRRCITKHLILNGWTTEAAGAAMNLHYTTIVYHKKKFNQLHEVDLYFRETWQEFQQV